MQKKQVIALVLIAALMGPATATAASPSQEVRGTWFLSFSGVPFAKLWIAAGQDAASYRLTASFKSTGIARIFKKMKTLTQSHGVRAGNRWQTLRYGYENRDEQKSTTLRYDAAGDLIERELIPEPAPHIRTPVPESQVRAVATVGSLLFDLQDMMRSLGADGDRASLRLYDGKRLADLHLVRQRKEALNATPTIRVSASRDLIAGFSPKETKRYNEGDPTVIAWLRESDGFPLAFEASLGFGTLRAQWQSESPE